MKPAASASRAPKHRLKAAKEPLGSEEADQDVRGEDKGVLERGREIDRRDALNHAHQERGQERAEDRAEPPERDDGVGEDGEREAYLREDGKEVGEDRPSDGDERGAETPGDGKQLLRPDADEHRRLAVLGRRLQGQPKLGPVDEEVEGQEQDQREQRADQERDAEGNAEQVEVRAAEPGEERVREITVVAREERDRGVLEEKEEADRREDLREG